MRVHLHLERDLRGIVDGKSYSFKDGQSFCEDKTSLVEKVDYVKKNLAIFCPEYSEIKEVTGLIVIKTCSLIKDYRGVKIISFEELDTLC